MNTVNLYGRIATELELTEVGKGKNKNTCTRFLMAVADGVDQNGEKKTQFIPCIVWNKLAEALCEYAKKGDRLALEGRLNIQRYKDNEDDETSKTSVQVIVNRFDFVETAGDNKTASSKRKR